MADDNGKAFASVINLWADKQIERTDKIVRAVSLKILARLIERSPVGDPLLWKVNKHQAKAIREAEDVMSMRRKSSMYSYTTKQGTRRLKPGARVTADDILPARYGKNYSDVGPRRHLVRRSGSAVRKPEGYTGGRFRSNWQVGIDVKPEGETGRIDKSGITALNKGSVVIAKFNGAEDSAIYFTNNVPYAVALEFGHSTQAPNGMVRLTVAEFQAIFNEAVKESGNNE